MSDELFIVLNGLLSFGPPLAWAIRELVLLRRDRGGDERRVPDPLPRPAPIGSDAPPRRALPPELLPPYPVAARARELERV